MSDGGGSRFSLPVGEGVGAMLCLAGGDVLGGASTQGYSATTQQAVVVAYHLIRHGEIDRETLAEEMTEMDGDHDAPSVFRSSSPQLRQWLDSSRAGEPVFATEPGLDPAVRVAPVGMWFRRRPDELVEAALETARLTHLD
ncbi:MAG: ADP-ribosylglycohydrolase family protein, partial [Acidimicrobiia bacterium]